MRVAAGIAHTLLVLLPSNVAALDLRVAEWPIVIDGYLNEWGGVLPAALQPGGEEIGVRTARVTCGVVEHRIQIRGDLSAQKRRGVAVREFPTMWMR